MTVTEQERVSAPDKERRDAREEQARVLEAAALEIEVRGHTKHMLMDGRGAVCANGALLCAQGAQVNPGGAAANADVWASPPGKAVMAIHGDLSQSLQLVTFNNASYRTADEVTFFLRWRAEEIRDGR